MNIVHVNNVLNELSLLEKVNLNKSELIISSTGLLLRDKNRSTIKKVTDYVTDWMNGRSSKMSSLSLLTRKIAVIVKDQKIKVDQLNLPQIDNAVNGLKTLARQHSAGSKDHLYINQAIKNLIYVYDEVDKQRALNNYFQKQTENNTLPIKNAIKEIIVSERLTRKTEISDPEKGPIQLSQAFSVDYPRFKKFGMNGQIYFSKPDKVEETPFSPLLGLIDKIKNILFYPFQSCPLANMSVAKMSHDMCEKMGKTAFERLGAVLNQSSIADRIEEWQLKRIPEEWRNDIFPDFHITQAGGFDFDVQANEKDVKVESQIVLSMNYLDKNSTAVNPIKTVGYVGLKRTIEIPKKELEQDLEKLPIDQRLPNLKVTDVSSPLSSSVKEAREGLMSF